jgi:hypothetical protein
MFGHLLQQNMALHPVCRKQILRCMAAFTQEKGGDISAAPKRR